MKYKTRDGEGDMTEDELNAITKDSYGVLSVERHRSDTRRLIDAVRSLTTQLAVAQGTATAETHRADRAEARVAELEREALHAAESRIPAPTVTANGGDLVVNGTYICRATNPHLVVDRLRKALGRPEVTT